MKATVFQVRPMQGGSWVVFEGGRACALSSFEIKRDAVDYVFELARGCAESTIEIRNARNQIESCGELAMGSGVREEE